MRALWPWRASWHLPMLAPGFAWPEGVSCAELCLLCRMSTPSEDALVDKPDEEQGKPEPNRALTFWGSIFSGAMLALINPLLISMYGSGIAVVNALFPLQFSVGLSLVFVAGAAVGILSWYSILLGMLQRHGSLMLPYLPKITMFLGCFFVLCGLIAVANDHLQSVTLRAEQLIV